MIISKRSNRIKEIYRILENQGNASTVFLANSLNITESSIRRDINYMVTSGYFPKLHRVHGGVILEDSKEDSEFMFELKLSLNISLKQSIALKAVDFIEPGDNIFIDSGTTCLCMVKELSNIPDLCVITADIKIAEELGKYRNIESSIIGGIIRPGYYTVGGIKALENLESFSANKIFMSVDGLNIENGITNASEFEVGIKKKLLQNNTQIYIIADHTKLDTHTLYQVSSLNPINTLITDSGVDQAFVDKLRNIGIKVIIA